MLLNGMKQDKELLLRDLSARLPYGVKMNHIADNEQNPKTLIGIDRDYVSLQSTAGYSYVPVEEYKPYLFPLSSMTEEQKAELNKLTYGSVAVSEDYFYDLCNCSKISTNEVINIVDWLNKNHFDYRGLIEKGLAIDCTNLNIY